MSSITIDNLMPTKTTNYLKNKGKIDINCISKDKFINNEPDIEFNSDVLLKSILQRRQKTRNMMVTSFNMCCDKIQEADVIGLTDLIFELPNTITMNNIYSKDIEIIRYISKKLQKQGLNTYIIDDKRIFITWKFIELNKEIALGNREI